MARRKNAGTLARVRHVAQVVRDVANFCTNPPVPARGRTCQVQAQVLPGL